ncbi:MAG: efflux RND transporter periplasmic adaptor subunit [Microcystaceae cyanobacterium]
MANSPESVKPALPQSSLRWIMVVLVLGLLVTGGTIVYGLKATKTGGAENNNAGGVSPKTSEQAKFSEVEVVSALGRIEPLGEVIKLSPSPIMGGAKISRILVPEGAAVKAGQVIAVLDSYERKVAALYTAREGVKVARANLAIIAAGAKAGQIQAQRNEVQRSQIDFERSKAEFEQKQQVNQATLENLRQQLMGERLEQQAMIKRLQAEVRQAENDYRRYSALANDGAIALADLEQRGLSMVTARQRLEEFQARLVKTEATLTQRIREQEAQMFKDRSTLLLSAQESQVQTRQAAATLNQIAEVRPVDIQKAQSELNLAMAQFNEAKAEVDTTLVRSPINGQIIKLYSRAGEKVSDADGIADVGRTDRMMVIAEVYEDDIRRVRPGQMAVISSENGSFNGDLGGTVQSIGLKIGKKDVLNTDPAADVDARVVEVKILLTPESSKKVAGLTYAKTLVKILP